MLAVMIEITICCGSLSLVVPKNSDARTGHYVLRTSHTEWSVEDTVRTYWRLTELEATFRSRKSELGLRPI